MLMDFWGVVLVIGAVLVGLWLVWKLIGGLASLALSGHDRRFRESPTGVAIRTLGERSGRNDGSPAAKRRAAAMFSDLLTHSPFSFEPGDDLTRADAIEGYEIAVRTSHFPIAVEAAYAVTGAASYDEIWHWGTDQGAVAMSSSFLALYPKWPASRGRTGSLEVAKLERGRWAMMMVLLEDRAVRDGLLPMASGS